MAKFSDTKATSHHRVIVYGPPKGGKTKLVGELAEAFNLKWFDLEAGTETLRQLPHEWQERIELYSIPDTRTFPIAIQTCLKIIKGGRFEICDTHGVIGCMQCKKTSGAFSIFDTTQLTADDIVVFDSITQLSNSALAHITKNEPEDFKPDWETWGNLGRLMDGFLSHVQQAKFNIACISHETEAEMEDGKTKLVPTAGTRNFSRNTAKYFDEVIYREVKNKKHTAASSTLYNGNILTGSRTGAILESQDTPSLIPIFKGEVPKTPVNNAVSNSVPAVAAKSALANLLKK